MVIYIGNFLSKHGLTESLAETFVRQLRTESIIINTASSKKNQILRILEMIYVCLKAKKKDLILIDTFSTKAFYFSLILGLISKIKHVKYCPILRGGNLPIKLNNNLLAHLYFSNSYKIIAPSLYLSNPFSKKYNNVICIPNFIPIENYPFIHRTIGKPNLIWVRSFHETYNPLLVIDLVEILIKDYPEIHIIMVGPDKDGTKLKFENELKRKKLESNFTITNKLEKKRWIELSQKSSIFINSTNFDNHPVSVIEAMALGLPVVSTNVGGVPYLIEDRINGLLFEKGNHIAFANTIKELLVSPELMSKLSYNSRRSALNYDWKVVSCLWKEQIGEFY